ncbi:MAG: SufD family Fe-S cluster assembly protein, partial [Fibrobacterota bacterium]
VLKRVCSRLAAWFPATISSHTVTEARLPKGSKFSHVRLKNHSGGGHHYGAVVAKLDTQARLETRLFSFGGVVSRDDFHVTLDGPEAFALLHGLVKTRGSEKADISIKLRHASPDCQSEQLFKALADDKSQANFQGTVYVDRDAQRTLARQSNKNILLSRDASVNSRPQLEILADDVKCSHGSATGRLDEKALQFLRCRGLSQESARKLLVRSFAGEMLLALPESPLRESIDALLGGD